jgi:hypothetical protein
MSSSNNYLTTSTGKTVTMHDAKLIISVLEFSSDPSFEQKVRRPPARYMPEQGSSCSISPFSDANTNTKVDWEAFAEANGYKHASSGRNQYAKTKARLGLVGKKKSGPKNPAPATTKQPAGVAKNRGDGMAKASKSTGRHAPEASAPTAVKTEKPDDGAI